MNCKHSAALMQIFSSKKISLIRQCLNLENPLHICMYHHYLFLVVVYADTLKIR